MAKVRNLSDIQQEIAFTEFDFYQRYEDVYKRQLLDIPELHPEEIASVRQVEKQELRGYVPYFGGYGLFGFYGHYFDLKNLERVKIYASEWRNFVEITDIYENPKALWTSISDAKMRKKKI